MSDPADSPTPASPFTGSDERTHLLAAAVALTSERGPAVAVGAQLAAAAGQPPPRFYRYPEADWPRAVADVVDEARRIAAPGGFSLPRAPQG